MVQEHLNQAVEQISKLNEINSSDLKLLVERYPYCQVAHVLYTKKLHEDHNSAFEKQLQRTASIVYDRNVLLQVIEKTELQPVFTEEVEQESAVQLPQQNELPVTELHAEPETDIDEIKPTIETPLEEAVSKQPVMIHEQIADDVLDDMIKEQEVTEITDREENETVKMDAETDEDIRIESPDYEPPLTGEHTFEIDEMIISEDAETMDEEIDTIDEEVDEITKEQLPFETTEMENKVDLDNINFDEPVTELPQETIVEEHIESPVYESPVTDENVFEKEEFPVSEELEPEGEDEITKEQLPFETTDPEEKVTLEEFATDEPVFELPGYNIERELGTLDAKDEIRIDIRRPVSGDEFAQEEEQPELQAEPDALSFSGWLNKVAGASKARLVELKQHHRPLQVNKEVVQVEQPQTKLPEITDDQEESDRFSEEFAGEIARKSIEPDNRLVTETYARILYMQGKFAKAIEVYEKLSLKKPSKSDYFAALIEQIKKRK